MIINFRQPESNLTSHFVVLAPPNSVFVQRAPSIVSSWSKGKLAWLKKRRWWNTIWKHLEHVSWKEQRVLRWIQRRFGAHSLRSGVLKGHVYLAGWCEDEQMCSSSPDGVVSFSRTTPRVRRVSLWHAWPVGV